MLCEYHKFHVLSYMIFLGALQILAGVSQRALMSPSQPHEKHRSCLKFTMTKVPPLVSPDSSRL